MENTTLNQLFKGYGLTKNQTKILSTLTQNKNCLNVKQISQLANIARESIYEVLFDLQKKGLVEKTITTPKKYCAIPLKITLNLLHKQKTRQIQELEILITQALANYNKSSKINNIKEKSQYILVPKNNKYLEKRDICAGDIATSR